MLHIDLLFSFKICFFPTAAKKRCPSKSGERIGDHHLSRSRFSSLKVLYLSGSSCLLIKSASSALSRSVVCATKFAKELDCWLSYFGLAKYSDIRGVSAKY